MRPCENLGLRTTRGWNSGEEPHQSSSSIHRSYTHAFSTCTSPTNTLTCRSRQSGDPC